MQGTWEISFLVDRDARIMEGRGACGEHLGQSLQSLIGQSLMSYVASGERPHLRRFIGQLDRPKAKRAAIISLHTSARGLRPYAMEAQAGRSSNDNWLLFTRSIIGGEGLEELDLPVVMANEGQFLRLVEMAAAQARDSLDLTTIEIGGLSDSKKLAGMDLAEIAAFEKSVGETLSSNAHEGIISNPSRGFYNLLHAPAKDGAAIRQELNNVAWQHGITPAQANIAHATMSVAPKTDLGAIRDSLVLMQKRMPGYKGWAEQPAKAAICDGQLAALVGIGAFMLGMLAIALWMMAR
jgi:hypothetical protein